MEAALDASPSCSTSMGVEGSLRADMAERRFSRSSGGRFKGCVSVLTMFLEFDREALLRDWFRRSDSLSDLVGDFETDRRDGEGDERSLLLPFLRDSMSGFFFVLKMAGRTIGSGPGRFSGAG